jgi:cell division protein FtsZ
VVATGLSRQGLKRAGPIHVVQTPPQQARRTGTYDEPFQEAAVNPYANSNSSSPVTAPANSAAQTNYQNLNTPSVWRTRDRSQAAAKVDALASGGMDDFEIPAFLRKQAD